MTLIIIKILRIDVDPLLKVHSPEHPQVSYSRLSMIIKLMI